MNFFQKSKDIKAQTEIEYLKKDTEFKSVF